MNRIYTSCISQALVQPASQWRFGRALKVREGSGAVTEGRERKRDRKRERKGQKTIEREREREPSLMEEWGYDWFQYVTSWYFWLLCVSILINKICRISTQHPMILLKRLSSFLFGNNGPRDCTTQNSKDSHEAKNVVVKSWGWRFNGYSSTSGFNNRNYLHTPPKIWAERRSLWIFHVCIIHILYIDCT